MACLGCEGSQNLSAFEGAGPGNRTLGDSGQRSPCKHPAPRVGLTSCKPCSWGMVPCRAGGGCSVPFTVFSKTGYSEELCGAFGAAGPRAGACTPISTSGTQSADYSIPSKNRDRSISSSTSLVTPDVNKRFNPKLF